MKTPSSSNSRPHPSHWQVATATERLTSFRSSSSSAPSPEPEPAEPERLRLFVDEEGGEGGADAAEELEDDGTGGGEPTADEEDST